MTTIAISHFKSHCLEIIDHLQKSQQPIIITKRNKPVAKVISFNDNQASIFGLLKNQAKIEADIIKPIDVKWHAND